MHYKKINYRSIASMIQTVVRINNYPMRLTDLIHSMQSQMQIGIDPKRVAYLLGENVVEKVEQDGDVRRVTTLVIP